MKDREDEAWQVIMKLHGLAHHEPSPMDTFAEEEFYQMKQQVAADLRTAASESLVTLFTKPSYRKRMICAFMMFFASQSTGILVVYSTYPIKVADVQQTRRFICTDR